MESCPNPDANSHHLKGASACTGQLGSRGCSLEKEEGSFTSIPVCHILVYLGQDTVPTARAAVEESVEKSAHSDMLEGPES